MLPMAADAPWFKGWEALNTSLSGWLTGER